MPSALNNACWQKMQAGYQYFHSKNTYLDRISRLMNDA
jgi:hypothetical protein